MADLHPALLMFITAPARRDPRHGRGRDAGFELTWRQAQLAAQIAEHGSRLTELAEQAQITKQSAGFLVDQLERAGLVERAPDPADARARLVALHRGRAPRGRDRPQGGAPDPAGVASPSRAAEVRRDAGGADRVAADHRSLD